MTSHTLLTDISPPIAALTFGSPKANALSSSLIDGMIGALRELDRNEQVRVIVLRSEGGKTFCAGASFDELEAISDWEEAKRFFTGFGRLVLALRDVSKFVVARVQGKVVGGGVGVVAACDYAIGSHASAFRLSEFALGIGPFVIGPAVERRIGPAAFGAMAIDTEWRDATWAFSRGLLSQQVADSDLDRSVTALAERLGGGGPEATRQLKRALWNDTSHWEELLAERAEISAGLWLARARRG